MPKKTNLQAGEPVLPANTDGGGSFPALARTLPYLYIAAAVIGSLASLVLTREKLQLTADPQYVPTCDVNPIVSCGSVMQTAQASFLGIPNSVYGLAAFSMLGAFGAILASGAKVPKSIWLAALSAATAGIVFMHYLFFQSTYRLGSICPWCFTVWMVTIPVFVYTAAFVLRRGYVTPDASLRRVTDIVSSKPWVVLSAWYALILGILLQHFWYYWSTLI